ncbi:MAG: kynureninase [Pseudomonadota bacterium]|nr:kynureninase [Pseudomonadota bacterium]
MNEQEVAALDRDDPLAAQRERFHIPDGVIYLDGHSLGAMPQAVRTEVATAVDTEWAEHLITAWRRDGWWRLPETLGDVLGRVIGAAPGQAVVTDTTSINLHKALWAALDANSDRPVMVAEAGSFPADLYITEGLLAGRPDLELRLLGEGQAIEELLDGDVAVVLLNAVDYRSGAFMDMAAMTARVHDAGSLVVWDLCHAAGAVPLALDAWDVDLAVGCTYKYLNGGPGTPAFLYAAERLHRQLRQPLSGWWSHAEPFAFEPGFRADNGIRKFLCGTQPVLSLRALKPALELFAGVDMAEVRAKSMALAELFIAEVEGRCAGHGLTVLGPRDPAARGSHVALVHAEAFAISQALIARGVIGDFRGPDVMRFGMAPLYVRYADIVQAAEILVQVMDNGEWREARFQTPAEVT